jgi:hypothetical protein
MKIAFTRITLAATSLTFAASTLVAVPVMADTYGGFIVPGTNNLPSLNTNPNANVGAGTTFNGPSPSPPVSVTTGKTAGTMVNLLSPANVTATENMYTQDGKTLMSQLMAAIKQHSAAERQKNCNAKKSELLANMAKINIKLGIFQSNVDTILGQIKTYQANKNLNVANWDALLLRATNAQAVSANAIRALNMVTPKTLNCADPNVADKIAAYRMGVQQARSDLNAYRNAVAALLIAVLNAKTTATMSPSTSPTASPSPTTSPTTVTGKHF